MVDRTRRPCQGSGRYLRPENMGEELKFEVLLSHYPRGALSQPTSPLDTYGITTITAAQRFAG